MHFPRLVSTVVLVLAASACSDENDSSPTTTTNPNQAAGSGGGGNATGSAAGSGGSAGTASLPTGSSGGSGTEAPGNPALNQGGSTATNPGGATAGAAGSSAIPPTPPAGDAGAGDTSMSFFLASRGGANGGNFGGIAGADALCETLAAAANPALAAKTWRAYLSTSTENARDRIGAGPWRNAAGVIIGMNVDQIHDQGLGMVNTPQGNTSEATWPINNINAPLREDGTPLPTQPVLHDILTGSNIDGTVSPSGTCSDWTSTTGTTRNGHSNRTGGGNNSSSWNSAHDTSCGAVMPGQNNVQNTVSQGGGYGGIYCFAID